MLVRAEDNGVPKRTQSARVSVIAVPVAKRSEHAPQMKTLDQHVEVTENDAPGFLVTLVQAYDEDDDQLWFDIVGKCWIIAFSFATFGVKIMRSRCPSIFSSVNMPESTAAE